MHAAHLTLENLRNVKNRIWEARSKWQDIGIELKLKQTDLEVISKKNGSDTDACFTEMLSIWLKQTKPRPTWSRMIRALKSRSIGFQQLAEHIEVNSGNKKRNKSLQLPLTEPDEESQEGPEFEGRLREQTKDLILKFNTLKYKLFDTLEHRSVPKLAEYLEVYRADNLTSFDDVKEFIKRKSSFYDYEIMKYIIYVAGTENDEQRLQQYEEHFEVYARGRVQSPSTSPMTHDSQLSKVCIKLDSEYDELQFDTDKLMQFHCRLCNLLKIRST
jgi:hypothetical protein